MNLSSTSILSSKPARWIVLLLIGGLSAPLVTADETVSSLADLGRVWGTVKYAHPWFGLHEIDWDGAGVRAIRRTVDTSGDGLSAAVEEMLAVLDDPETRLVPDCIPSTDPVERDVFITADQRLYIPPGARVSPEQIRTHPRVVFDLRPGEGRCSSDNIALFEALAPAMFSGTISAPVHRKLSHFGFRSQDPEIETYAGYQSTFVYEGAEEFSGTGASGRTTVLIVDDNTEFPIIAEAMVAARVASVVSVGTDREPAVRQIRISLHNGFHARIRTSESSSRIAPIAVLSKEAAPEQILLAASLGPSARRRGVSVRSRDIAFEFVFDRPYPEMLYPDPEYRVLAAWRYWNIIRYFYPYKHLISEWDPQFEPIIEALLRADSRDEYELALGAITLFVPDGHSWASSEAYIDLFGRGAPPFQTFLVEGKPVVAVITNEAATTAGISLGDELLAIDGRPIADRISEVRDHVSSSTEGYLETYSVYNAPRGEIGSEPVMKFRRPDGSEYETRVERLFSYRVAPSGPKWKMLEGNIGYANLSNVTFEDLEPMFRELMGTRAIIFDMRGYPAVSSVALAHRLNVTGKTRIAQIRIPHIVGGEVREYFELQDIGPSPFAPYRGKTFMLIDPRAISASEHMALALETVAETTFVGTPTAGANGNISILIQPGDNLMTFTAMDVRHADGSQLQRRGIQPDVTVGQTIAGIAAGRDEVLEKAIELAMK